MIRNELRYSIPVVTQCSVRHIGDELFVLLFAATKSQIQFSAIINNLYVYHKMIFHSHCYCVYRCHSQLSGKFKYKFTSRCSAVAVIADRTTNDVRYN